VKSIKEERCGQKQLEDVKQKLEEKGSQIDTMLVGDDSGERLQLAQRTKWSNIIPMIYFTVLFGLFLGSCLGLKNSWIQ
jgi:hypothetical protein